MNEAQETAIVLDLTRAQYRVLDDLLLGKTQKDAARDADISEAQVSRWKNHDPAFVAELNRRRREVWEAQREQIVGLVESSIGVLQEELETTGQTPYERDRRVKIALAVLCRLRDPLPLIGSDDPRDITAVWQEEEKERNIIRLLHTRKQTDE